MAPDESNRPGTRTIPSSGASGARRFVIGNSRGLHARASAKFVRCAEKFDADIRVSRDGQTVGGTSIMGLMMLAAGCGSTIDVSAEGPDAEAALRAIEALVSGKFDED